MTIRALTKRDIGKLIIFGLIDTTLDKKYGKIVDFNDEFVYCTWGASNKRHECRYEDLCFDRQPKDPYGDPNLLETWDALMKSASLRRQAKILAQEEQEQKKTVKKKRAKRKTK